MTPFSDYPCRFCVPPKRYPGCGDHCKEYAEASRRFKEKQAGIRREKLMLDAVSEIHSANPSIRQWRKEQREGKW